MASSGKRLSQKSHNSAIPSMCGVVVEYGGNMWNEIRTKLGLNNSPDREQRHAQPQRSADNWQATRPAGKTGSATSEFNASAIANPKPNPRKTTTENALSRHRHNWYADPSMLIEASLTEKWDDRKKLYPEDVAVPNKTKVTYSRLASYVSTLSDEDREAALTDLKSQRTTQS